MFRGKPLAGLGRGGCQPNPGSRRAEIPYLVTVQNDHITSKTGATVVIPLRANAHLSM